LKLQFLIISFDLKIKIVFLDSGVRTEELTGQWTEEVAAGQWSASSVIDCL